ncbi:MAG: xanthine dehydrogenase family protein molybdopterin-binding subunit [Planctomycetota bacterium]|nr:xanthine dehydrogenase family protein molybdopterin-binding subunit [Planctomycetota bacterium]
MSASFVGRAAQRPDAGDKLAGKARYIHDLSVPGMLWGKIKYSEHAHARIRRMDTSRAAALPGVRAVVTAYDTPELRMGFLRDNVALKKDKVRQFRDEVAAVAAIDADVAREAIELIEVEYEPLVGVFSPEEAMAEGAPLVHEIDARGRPRTDNRVPVDYNHESGDLAAGERASAFVAEGEYSVPRIQQSCMGTAGCIAEFDLSGNLTLTAKTQIPFLAQRDFTRALAALGLRGKNVRVVVPALGGGFGTGLDTHIYEYIAILLAWKSGRPVKILHDREEEFAYLSPRQSATTRIRQGCDGEGRLTFREISVTQDNGAYGSWGLTYPSVMLMPATSLYRVGAVRFSSEIVYTNNTYCQAMRGYGNPEVTWPIESTLDELAEQSGIDPIELRRINCNRPGDVSPMGLRMKTCGLETCLERTAQRLDWKTKRGAGRSVSRGVGVASLMHVGGGGKIYRSDGSGIILELDDYGHVNVLYGGVEMGQGLHSAIALMVADALGVRPQKVLVAQTDTATCPWDVGTHASRGAFMAGNAALLACEKLRARLFEAAEGVYASLVEAQRAALTRKAAGYRPSDFDCRTVERGSFDLCEGVLSVKGAPDDPALAVPLERLLRALHFPRDGSVGTVFVQDAFYEPPTELPDWSKGVGNMSANYTFGTQGVEVEVDRETGEVRILGLVFLIDVGRVINPQTLRGQMYGGIAQGLGYALYEQVHTEQGRITNPGFTDYKLPTAVEMGFPIELEFIETDDPSGPFGAKGVGEPALVPTAPAIANAIQDAVGVRIRSLPITPEKVLAALRAADADSGVARGERRQESKTS